MSEYFRIPQYADPEKINEVIELLSEGSLDPSEVISMHVENGEVTFEVLVRTKRGIPIGKSTYTFYVTLDEKGTE